MALTLSQTTRQARAQATFGGATYTPPANYDLALFTGDPNNGGVECTGTGYARISLANVSGSWTEVAGSLSRSWRNATDWIWTAAAGAGWGTPNWICLFNTATNQKEIAFEIENAVTVQVGDPFRIFAGDLTIQLLN